MYLAWRNIWRNKRRTAITVVAIAFATAILVFSHGLQVSSHKTSVLATTQIFQGAMQIQRRDYFDNPQVYRSIANPTEILKTMRAHPAVRAIAPRAIGFALIASEDRTYGVQVVGTDPLAEPTVSTIPSLVRRGSYFTSESFYHVALGAALARNLRVDIGSELTLLGQGKDGSLAAAVLIVEAIYESGSSEIDRSLVQIPLAAFQEIFYMHSDSGAKSAGEVHSFIVQLQNLAALESNQSELTELLADPTLAVLRWDQVTPGLKQAQEFDRKTNWIFHLSLVVIVIIGILNTFLMSILERTREFGMLLALGMRPGGLTRLILLECAQLVLLGAVLGSLLGYLIIMYYNQHGFVVPGTQEFLRNWNLPDALYPEPSVEALATGPLIVLFSALLLILPFSLRPYFLNPTEAMRS